MPDDINFCQRCGNDLSEQAVEGKRRPVCTGCGQVVYLDPKLAAVAVVDTDGKLVLVRRGIEPAMGLWSYPGGYVDRGETVEDAAIREAKEETGLDIRLTGLIGLYSTRDNPVVLAAYSAEAAGGTLRPGDEVLETGLFRPAELPPLAFPHDGRILADWQISRPGSRR